MSLRIVVTIPRTYLLDQLNVATPHDVELYQESIAFALTDRWEVEDLQFQYSDIATAHFFDCVASDPSTPVPSDNDFSVALQAAVERYKFAKTGDPGTFLRAGSTALDYLFTPLMTTQMPEDPIVASKEEQADESSERS
jgi:hypothetical protein